MAKCNCSGTTIVTTLPCSQVCASCFIPSNYVIPVIDRVAPCGGIGNLNVALLNDFTSTCTGNTMYSLYSFNTNYFNSVAITAGGLLSYELSSDAEPGIYGDIVYRVRCDAENVGGYGVIQVSARDLCLTSNCTPQQTCNKCDGICVNIPIDLSIDIN